ncbi:MAG: dephospho-CoA kinase [Candidatus Lightella neohaematopini]|nr:dephospho-CoA kinase [Candidatus Lightella neohaematopini]MCV2528739.1 dephospho-CoA kinase [Candidatus Lightella neohaematopini]
MTYIVAVTGSIGSGKTTVTNLFKKLNVPIIDADIIARELVSYNKNIINSITNYFGRKIIKIKSTISRSTLKYRIFNNNSERIWLNNLLHPIIINRINTLLYNINTSYVILVVPLLIECNLQHYMHNITVINTTYENKLQRLLNRDDINRKQINKILNTQVNTKVRLSYANIIIDNNLLISSNSIIILHQYYLSLATNLYINDNFNTYNYIFI